MAMFLEVSIGILGFVDARGACSQDDTHPLCAIAVNSLSHGTTQSVIRVVNGGQCNTRIACGEFL